MDSINCLPLFMHRMPCAFVLDLAKAGSNKPAKMAIMAITTRSSIKVNPGRPDVIRFGVRILGLGLCCLIWLTVSLGTGETTRHPRLGAFQGQLCVCMHSSPVLGCSLPHARHRSKLDIEGA